MEAFLFKAEEEEFVIRIMNAITEIESESKMCSSYFFAKYFYFNYYYYNYLFGVINGVNLNSVCSRNHPAVCASYVCTDIARVYLALILSPVEVIDSVQPIFVVEGLVDCDEEGERRGKLNPVTQLLVAPVEAAQSLSQVLSSSSLQSILEQFSFIGFVP